MLSSSVLLRRSLALSSKKATVPAFPALDGIARRFKSDDVGDVIGIDLGTTNSCVSIMVRRIQHIMQCNAMQCNATGWDMRLD